MTYGIPYTGSKSAIAKEILTVLPSGKRFVDLFGGGFAMSHCCLLEFCSGIIPKYERVLWNDHNPLLKPLIEKAIKGEFNYNVFTPEWVSRERFFAEKENDGYVKWIWSFGNNGNDYLYGKSIEEQKRQIHQLIVFGEENEFTRGIKLQGNDIKSRRLEWMKYIKSQQNRNDLSHLVQLERLQNLERLANLQNLEQLECLQNLELKTMDYHDYVYQDGDVVYCDIPYENARQHFYDGGFNHEEFKQWAKSQPYPVYVSNYIDTRIIWQKTKRTSMNSTNNCCYKQECLYQYGGY